MTSRSHCGTASRRVLLIVTAVLETATGLALVVSPSVPVSLLLGSPVDTAVGLAVARVAGAALLSLALACWLARDDGRSRAATGLIAAVLLYNVVVGAVLVDAGLGLRISGVGLWPAVLLHVAMAVWCLACLRTGRRTDQARGARVLILAAAFLAAGSRVPAQTEGDPVALSGDEPAPAAEAAPPATGDETAPDEDPTRTVLFNIRLEYRELLDGASAQILTLRRDVAIPPARKARPHHKYALLRFDLPLARVDRGGVVEDGLGDLYFQALHVHPFNRGFALATGVGLVMPTASEDSLGTGKWVLAPAVVPIWYLPKIRGMAYVKVQDFFSVAGDETRSEINVLAVTPTLTRRLGRRGFMTLDSESRTNWREDGQTSWMSGVLMGRFLNPRWGFWAKVEVPWGENRTGDWTLRTSFVRREVR